MARDMLGAWVDELTKLREKARAKKSETKLVAKKEIKV